MQERPALLVKVSQSGTSSVAIYCQHAHADSQSYMQANGLAALWCVGENVKYARLSIVDM